MLAVSGRLNLKAGGPSVMVPVDPELVKLLYKPSQWQVTPRRDRARPAVDLPVRQAQPAAAVHGDVRRADAADELCPAGVEHARAAGAGAAQRHARPTTSPRSFADRLGTEAGGDSGTHRRPRLPAGASAGRRRRTSGSSRSASSRPAAARSSPWRSST